MEINSVYSSWKLLALCLVFLAIGSVSAMGVEKLAPPPVVNLPRLVVQLDRETYHIGETLVIFMANSENEEIRFSTQPFGLRFEKLADEKWETVSINDNYSCYPSLRDTLTGTGTEFCKVHLTFVIGEDFSLGTYRVSSSGKIAVLDASGKEIGQTTVDASAEFKIESGPPVTSYAPKMIMAIDKNTYEIGDRKIAVLDASGKEIGQTTVEASAEMTIVIDNMQEEEIRFETRPFGLHFEKMVDGKWEPVTVNGNYTCILSPNDTLTGIGAYSKVYLTFVIGQDTFAGAYRLISSGKIGQTVVETSAEFNIIQNKTD